MTVRPFAARVVRPEWAERVVCPMYDAFPADRRPQFLVDNPDSYLHVMRSQADLPGASVADVASANAEALLRLLAADAYDDDPTPAMFAYCVRRGGEQHCGIVAEVGLSGFVDGQVLGHEAVHQERVEALLHHFAEVPARSELVALIHRSDAQLTSVLADTMAGEPMLRLRDVTDVEQAVWRLSPEAVALVSDRLGTARHYIADGHHRVAASVAQWRAAGEPADAAVLCVLYPEDQMHLLAFHRRVAGPVDAPALLAALADGADVEPVERDAPGRTRGVIDMYLTGGWHRLRLRPDPAAAGAEALDVAWLDRTVLTPVLGVGASDPRIGYLSELADLDQALAQTDADGGVLFRMAAPGMDQLEDVAERGQVMPPKSTYFEPKPRAGLFLRFS